MAKFSIYKYCKTDAGWRYCKAASYPNGKIKLNVVLVKGEEERHTEGSYFLNQRNQWIGVGDDALDAQRERLLRLNRLEYERLSGKAPAPATVTGRTPLAAAEKKYFSNCEARGLDPKSIRAYRSAVSPFVAQCKKTYVEDVGTDPPNGLATAEWKHARTNLGRPSASVLGPEACRVRGIEGSRNPNFSSAEAGLLPSKRVLLGRSDFVSSRHVLERCSAFSVLEWSSSSHRSRP